MAIRNNVHKFSDPKSVGAAGSTIEGAAVEVADNSYDKVKHLSAVVSVSVETSGLSLMAKWQVSDLGKDWIDVANGPQNAGSVPLVMGAGEVTRMIPAPDAVHGWRKARLVVVSAGVDGSKADVVSNIAYCYRAVL